MIPLTVAASLLFPAALLTQDDHVTIVHAARMLDVRTGALREDVTVVVRGTEIESVGIGDDVPDVVAARVTALDLGDKTLLPGLMDMHVHLTGAVEGDFVHRDVHEGPADAALRGAANCRKTLLAGFTTVRNVGAGDFVDIALARAVERGDIDGPWIFGAGHSLPPTRTAPRGSTPRSSPASRRSSTAAS